MTLCNGVGSKVMEDIPFLNKPRISLKNVSSFSLCLVDGIGNVRIVNGVPLDPRNTFTQ